MNASYWEATAHRPADAVVVGAGLVGLSAAMHLAQAGLRVTVLEAQPGLANASTRNAGFACFGSAGELLADVQTLGEAATLARVRLRFEGLQLLRHLLGDDAIGYQPVGGNELFRTPAEAEPVLAALPDLNRLLRDVTGHAETYRPTTTHGYPSIHTTLEGSLHSGWLMQHLLADVRRLGVDVRLGTAVAAVESQCVRLADGTELRAPRILLAAGARTSQLWPRETITPARGYLFVTTPLPSVRWRGTWHLDRGYVYWREVDHRLLLGGARHQDLAGETTLAPGTNPRIKDWLIRFAIDTLGLPAADWRIDYEWTGTMGFAPDDTPYVRAVAPGVWVAAGLGGIGVATGMALGRDAAHLLLAD